MNSKPIVKIQHSLEMTGFIISNGTQCRFVSMTIKTPVVKIRSGNPWGAGAKTKRGLYKVARKLGLINVDYVASVERKVKAGLGLSVDYKPGETWFEHLKTGDGRNLPIVQHKDETKRGKYYLQYFPRKSTNVFVNEAGEVQADSAVEPWLYAESEKSEFKPATFVVDMANVMELRASGVILQAEDLPEAEQALADDVSISFADNAGDSQAKNTLVNA